ncbi:MAG: hypothetical protein ISS79_13170 [Phycisphaerae bacterium]|nr:hypothetical protein [Phycisphaerae bacterium]
MAGKKTKKSKRKKRSAQSPLSGIRLSGILQVFAVVCALGGIVLGVIYWDRFIKQSASASEDVIPLEIKAMPAWVNDRLKDNLSIAARADGLGLKLDETAAGRVQQNIQTLFPWLDNVRVQTMHDRLLIEGRWRMPLVFVKRGLDSFYVDRDLVVLDFVEMPHLTITKVIGLVVTLETPTLGQVWQRDDLAAAVALAEVLTQWDRERTPDKPLLDEIAAIDVSNYNGWKNSRSPHIVLYTTDNAEVIWGAELGKWQRHLEATDAEKLAKLYSYYEEYGSLLGDVKYINLRDPQDRIHLPIDRY